MEATSGYYDNLGTFNCLLKLGNYYH